LTKNSLVVAAGMSKIHHRLGGSPNLLYKP